MKSSDIKNTLRDEDADVFNWRELKALEAMDSCHYEYELQGQIGRGVGRGTLQELVRRGLAKQGPSPETARRGGLRDHRRRPRCSPQETIAPQLRGAGEYRGGTARDGSRLHQIALA